MESRAITPPLLDFPGRCDQKKGTRVSSSRSEEDRGQFETSILFLQAANAAIPWIWVLRTLAQYRSAFDQIIRVDIKTGRPGYDSVSNKYFPEFRKLMKWFDDGTSLALNENHIELDCAAIFESHFDREVIMSDDADGFNHYRLLE